VCTECRRCSSTATGLRQSCNIAATELQQRCNRAATALQRVEGVECIQSVARKVTRTPWQGSRCSSLQHLYSWCIISRWTMPQKKRVWSRQSILEECGLVKNRNFTSTTWPDFKKTATVMNLRIVQGLKDTQEFVLFCKSKTQESGFRQFRTHCTCLPRLPCVGCESRTPLLSYI
jgi:hypothetical protein